MVSTLTKLGCSNELMISVVEYTTYHHIIHSIRHAVFVCEQSIPSDLEVDHYDPVSQHVLAWRKGNPVGTGRLTPDGRIGRVAVALPLRRQGVGRGVIEKLLEIAQHQSHQEVVLAAQHHAVRFYEKLGFQQEGQLFETLGIDHIMMRKELN
ncbi:MAG: GNAT family N-acetyltransferase [Cyanobacteria bacterium P01_F01_bin.86]